MKKYWILACFVVLGFGLSAQQQVLFTQYMFNQLALNPAYAGIHEGISASFLMREQWVGFDGAPSTQTFSIHSPLLFKPISLGAVFVRDKIGITTTNTGHFSYAYRIKISNQIRLSMALQANVNHYSADYSTDGVPDPALLNATRNLFRANFGAGVLLHSDKFYVGIASPQFLNQRLDPDNPDSQAELVRHYYMSGGIVFPLAPNILAKPNFLVKNVAGAPTQIDLNFNVLFGNILWVGTSYRSLDSFDALIQVQVSKQFQIGYAFDFLTTTQIGDVSSGSHEIMINYIFELPKTKILTPRYF